MGSRAEDLRWLVDIGAHIGDWTSTALGFCRPVSIDAFEPDPRAFRALTASLGDRPGVHLYPIALGDREGKIDLRLTGDGVFSSVLAPVADLRACYPSASVKVVETLPVPLSTLDLVLGAAQGEISLLKLDVQGLEKQVLTGASKCLSRTRAILVEINFLQHYEGATTPEELLAVLTKEHGFVFWNISEAIRTPQGRALWADAVFVKRA